MPPDSTIWSYMGSSEASAYIPAPLRNFGEKDTPLPQNMRVVRKERPDLVLLLVDGVSRDEDG